VALPLALRAAAHSAFRGALCTAGLAGLALTLDPAAAAAARPHHGKGGSHKAASHQAASHKASSHRAPGHDARHAGRHASRAERRAGHRHHGRHVESEVAESPLAINPPAIDLPAFALPDLAVTAATVPAGRTLGGFGGPAETAVVPASAARRTLAALTHSATTLLDALVSRARGQLGTRYVFGGAEPGAGLDCSSFARYAMEALGVRLPRTANQQAQIGRPVPRDPNLLRPGDLLTFGTPSHVSHVGIYLGQGRFIHASVKHGEVIETTIERNRSLFRRWQGARRLLAAVDDSAAAAPATGG
jgi:cell wall-associated NlpC family hydrolase